jgi:hypothetical protein
MTINPSLLDPGERLLWSEKPSPVSYALKKGGLTSIFGIPFFAFSLFWIAMAGIASDRTPNGPAAFFWMFGIPFVLIGLGLVLSPLWYYWRGTQATYALTNRRAIIDLGGQFPRSISVPLNQIPFVEVRASADGRGHVLFQEAVTTYYSRPSLPQRDGFIGISKAEHVGQILRTSIDKARETPVSGAIR